jgi:ABC-type polysaccharide/polyol phosphate transport system ATPase subunit
MHRSRASQPTATAPSLKAIALSIKRGTDVGTISVGGQVRTTGDNVITVEIDGEVGQIEIAGGVVADASNSDAIHVRGDIAGLDRLSANAVNEEALVRTA